MKTNLARFFLLASAGVSVGCASQQVNDASMSAVSNEEEVITLPTVLVHDQPDGTVVEENIGVQSFGQTMMWTVDHMHVSSVVVGTDGSLCGFTVGNVGPELSLQPGVYQAEELRFDLTGKLVGVTASRTDNATRGTVQYTVVGTSPDQTVSVTSRHNSGPGLCNLTRTMLDQVVAYTCDCPANP